MSDYPATVTVNGERYRTRDLGAMFARESVRAYDPPAQWSQAMVPVVVALAQGRRHHTPNAHVWSLRMEGFAPDTGTRYYVVTLQTGAKGRDGLTPVQEMRLALTTDEVQGVHAAIGAYLESVNA